jgi:hypothetical protein
MLVRDVAEQDRHTATATTTRRGRRRRAMRAGVLRVAAAVAAPARS